MTKIIDGYAQPDIVAEKDGEKVAIFVETPSTLRYNIKAIAKSYQWLQEKEPKTRVDLIQTVPRHDSHCSPI